MILACCSDWRQLQKPRDKKKEKWEREVLLRSSPFSRRQSVSWRLLTTKSRTLRLHVLWRIGRNFYFLLSSILTPSFGTLEATTVNVVDSCYVNRLPHCNGCLRDSWQDAYLHDVLGSLRLRQWTLSNRSSQRRRRNSFDVCSSQQHGGFVCRRTAGQFVVIFQHLFITY